MVAVALRMPQRRLMTARDVPGSGGTMFCWWCAKASGWETMVGLAAGSLRIASCVHPHQPVGSFSRSLEEQRIVAIPVSGQCRMPRRCMHPFPAAANRSNQRSSRTGTWQLRRTSVVVLPRIRLRMREWP